MRSPTHQAVLPPPPVRERPAAAATGPGTASDAVDVPARPGDLRSLARAHRALLVVLGSFVAAAFVVPTLAPVAISDDWLYARTVETFVRDGVFRLPDLAVANLVFQILWGGLFATVFGLSLGVLRLSTLVLTFLGGLGFYGLARELGVNRNRSALGTALYLFNPLSFVLGYTFMTDAFFTPLLVISTWLFVRGLRRGDAGWRSTVAGSAGASLAFLVRQQGALIPLAVVTFLLLTRRLRVDRDSLRRLLHVALVPGLTIVGFYAWLVFVHGMPEWQGEFAKDLEVAGVSGGWLLTRRLTFIELMYLGLFVVPLALAVAPRVVRLARSLRSSSLAFAGAWTGVVLVGLLTFSHDRLMPYIPHFLRSTGMGPDDLIIARPDLGGQWVFDLLTLGAAASALVLGLVLARGVRSAPSPGRVGAGLCVSLLLWQAVGALMPSFHFRDWTLSGWQGAVSAPSLDRYILPLVPLGIALALWALQGVRLHLRLAWVAVAAFAVVSVAGTRDALLYQAETWNLAGDARAAGVALRQLDGGAAWDGYHMNEASQGSPVMTPGAAWWIWAWAPAIDSTYLIANRPIDGYDVVRVRPYSAWLHRAPTQLFLLRRAGAQGPL